MGMDIPELSLGGLSGEGYSWVESCWKSRMEEIGAGENILRMELEKVFVWNIQLCGSYGGIFCLWDVVGLTSRWVLRAGFCWSRYLPDFGHEGSKKDPERP